MTDWHLFSESPAAPVQAEVFYGNLPTRHGHAVSAIIAPYRDERRYMAYWDGKDWYAMGTGHALLNEFGDDPPEWIPTHWRALPPLPDGEQA